MLNRTKALIVAAAAALLLPDGHAPKKARVAVASRLPKSRALSYLPKIARSATAPMGRAAVLGAGEKYHAARSDDPGRPDEWQIPHGPCF